MDTTQSPDSGASTNPRICLLSLRNLHKNVFRGGIYEFEDVIREIDDVQLLTPKPYSSFVIQRLPNRIKRLFTLVGLNPGIKKLRLKRSYDLFVAMCLFPTDLAPLNAIKGWRERCRTSVCFLAEIWAEKLHEWKHYMKIMSQFDYVVLNCSGSVQPVQDAVRRSCFYMPGGVDAIRFCPHPNPPLRSIDVYNMGRKSSVTHQALLKMAEQNQIFYIYDTLNKMETSSHEQHRSLIASIAKRSRYFMANAAKIGQEVETSGQGEIGYRFFEGAASGTVIIGEPPKNEDFRKYFDWRDVVIHLPFDAQNIAEVLADLDSQPDRLKKIRRNNIVQSLLRHDWVYRWRSILDIVGLKPRPALIAREKRLKKLAEDVKKECM